LIFFDTKYVLYDDFLKLDKIFSIALNQLSLKKDQIEYFSLTKQLARLYKTYNYKDCDNLFYRINKNFFPEGYLDFIKTAKIINSCYFTENENGG
jgi:hypothetical protein